MTQEEINPVLQSLTDNPKTTFKEKEAFLTPKSKRTKEQDKLVDSVYARYSAPFIEILDLQMQLHDQQYKGNSVSYIFEKKEVYLKDSQSMGPKFKEAVESGAIILKEGVDDWIAGRLGVKSFQQS